MVRMSELTMSAQEREAFLAAPHVGLLAVARPDGPPLMTPLWYRYEPGGAVEFTTEGDSEKARLLRASGIASLCVQREEMPPAYVTVDGPVEIGDADRDLRIDIASRYLGPEGGVTYVDNAPVADDIVVRLTPSRWRTNDFAKLDMPTA